VRNKEAGFIIILLALAILGALLSCATDQAPLPIENSLPQDELAYYSDDFDHMREDLWERAGYVYREEQVQNFRQADLRFEKSKLIIRTKTGSFSKGGLGSKFALRSDFDIQLHCRIDFIKNIPVWDMDQLVTFAVLDKTLKLGKMNSATIGLTMRGGAVQGNIFCNYVVNGKRKKGGSQRTENFNGTFRFVRTNKTISTLYRKAGEAEWTKMYTLRVTDKDMIVGFQLRNFFGNRTTIQANHSISAEFDSLKINAAQEIIEEEI
jgi:hypothetical protein